MPGKATGRTPRTGGAKGARRNLSGTGNSRRPGRTGRWQPAQPRRLAGGGIRNPVAGRARRMPLAQVPQRVALDDRGIGGDQVEGRRSVLELLACGRRNVQVVFMEEGLEPSPILEDIESLTRKRHIRLIELPPVKMEQEALSQSYQGVIARAAPLELYTIDDLAMGVVPSSIPFPAASWASASAQPVTRSARAIPFLVLLDGITDPHNLGSILRSAECAGATGIVLPRHRSARITAVATKAASGAVEPLNFALVGGIPATLMELEKMGVQTVGFDSAARTSLYDVSTSPSDPVALVFGSEGKGLSQLTKRRCSVLVSIPQYGQIDSLNVAAAAAVGLSHVARVRSRIVRTTSSATLE